MLRLHRLTMANFGPFKGEQSIVWPDEDGVTIVYGENMRGKTTLLNAIRYALFGKVLGRGSREESLHDIGNWEAHAEGTYGFKVILSFEVGDRQYELTRTCCPRPGIDVPQGDIDYVQESFLQRDGVVLGPEQGKVELERIMPEQVSRFFLFDGELLQEYEQLLRDEHNMGREITAAIERILGIPVLTNGRTDLRVLHDNAQRQESRVAQQDKKTQELGVHLNMLIEQRENHDKEVGRLNEDLENLRAERARLEDTLRKTTSAKALLDEQERLEGEIKGIDERRQQKEMQLKNVMKDAWRGMLDAKLRPVSAGIQRQIAQSEAEQRSAGMIAQIKQALAEGQCPTCAQTLTAQASEHLEHLVAANTSAPTGEDDHETSRLRRVDDALRAFVRPDQTELVRTLMRDIDDLATQKADKQGRLGETREKTRGIDQSEVRRYSGERDEALKEIALVEEGLKAQEKTLEVVTDNIARLNEQLGRQGGADVAKARRKRELCARLGVLFDESISVYRDRLRVRVERDATDLFRHLTTEPEYERLQINDSYGLTIVHQDGQTVPVRSAGAEHIVALSLMGALQKNAPLRGPLIMDSPFGRLDEKHTTNVIEALPRMAPQVTLLVYTNELNPEQARAILRGRLRAEYEMGRVSARHTALGRKHGDD